MPNENFNPNTCVHFQGGSGTLCALWSMYDVMETLHEFMMSLQDFIVAVIHNVLAEVQYVMMLLTMSLYQSIGLYRKNAIAIGVRLATL